MNRTIDRKYRNNIYLNKRFRNIILFTTISFIDSYRIIPLFLLALLKKLGLCNNISQI